jgi:hypothetical protein
MAWMVKKALEGGQRLVGKQLHVCVVAAAGGQMVGLPVAAR